MDYSDSLERSTTTRSLARDPRSVGGLTLLAMGSGFVTVLMLAAAMAPGYDFGGGAISDLGVLAETALLFNAALVLVGVLNAVAGYALYRMHGSRPLFGAFLLAGLGAVVAGVFPLDTGAPHSLGALLAFLFFNVQALGMATRLTGAMRYLSVLAGAVGLVFVGLMIVGDGGNAAAFGPIGHGGTERMIVYPAMLWMVALGGYLLGDGVVRRATGPVEPGD